MVQKPAQVLGRLGGWPVQEQYRPGWHRLISTKLVRIARTPCCERFSEPWHQLTVAWPALTGDPRGQGQWMSPEHFTKVPGHAVLDFKKQRNGSAPACVLG